ncbi:MAG: hypothetical protein NTV25_04560 [Methanothrix sp.]|nr:hypothetical protein [Methanothrix sp.]
MESETAKEILQEVLGVRISDVDEMIQNRFQAHLEEARYEENGLWPREFWLEGRDWPGPSTGDTRTGGDPVRKGHFKINFFGFMKIVLGSALASTPAPQFL